MSKISKIMLDAAGGSGGSDEVLYYSETSNSNIRYFEFNGMAVDKENATVMIGIDTYYSTTHNRYIYVFNEDALNKFQQSDFNQTYVLNGSIRQSWTYCPSTERLLIGGQDTKIKTIDPYAGSSVSTPYHRWQSVYSTTPALVVDAYTNGSSRVYVHALDSSQSNGAASLTFDSASTTSAAMYSSLKDKLYHYGYRPAGQVPITEDSDSTEHLCVATDSYNDHYYIVDSNMSAGTSSLPRAVSTNSQFSASGGSNLTIDRANGKAYIIFQKFLHVWDYATGSVTQYELNLSNFYSHTVSQLHMGNDGYLYWLFKHTYVDPDEIYWMKINPSNLTGSHFAWKIKMSDATKKVGDNVWSMMPANNVEDDDLFAFAVAGRITTAKGAGLWLAKVRYSNFDALDGLGEDSITLDISSTNINFVSSSYSVSNSSMTFGSHGKTNNATVYNSTVYAYGESPIYWCDTTSTSI